MRLSSDFESGTRKTIDITVKAEKMTADILKSALQEFVNGKAEKSGRMTYKQLESKSLSKLDSIDVSADNIGDFLKTARKYDVDFALKSVLSRSISARDNSLKRYSSQEKCSTSRHSVLHSDLVSVKSVRNRGIRIVED